MVCCCSQVAAVYAQATDSNLTGIVSGLDRSGTSRARNCTRGTRRRRRNITQRRIATEFTGLTTFRPELYSITATAKGFGTATLQNVYVVLNQTATVNMSLQVAGVSTTVEVREAPTVIDTTTAQVQSTFGERASEDLPMTYDRTRRVESFAAERGRGKQRWIRHSAKGRP